MSTEKLNRRELVVAGLGLAAGQWALGHEVPLFAAKKSIELVSAYGDWVTTFIDKIDPPLKSELVFFNPQSRRFEPFTVPFRVHTLVQNSARLSQLFLVPKWGQDLCEFDRAAGKVGRRIQCKDDRRFFGHAVWDVEAEGFWVTEHDDKNFEGRLVLRGPDLKVKEDFSSFGAFPHELQFSTSGDLLVANSGNFDGEHGDRALDRRVSNLSWVDRKTGRLKHQIPFSDVVGIAGASHFLQIPDSGEIFVGTMSKTAEQVTAAFRVKGDKVDRLTAEVKAKESFQGEIVSFAYSPEDRRVLWTQSKAHGVFSQSLDALEPARLVYQRKSKGMIGINGHVFFTAGNERDLYSVENGAVLSLGRAPWRWGSRWGSHLVAIES
ncbi:MAG: DUF1513 domain-containing protein [Bdellovibrionales bacterium]